MPTGLIDLDEDYRNLQKNFQQLDTTFGIDHTTVSNTTPQNGYHRVVHSIPFSTTLTNPPTNQPVAAPANVAGIGELFTASIADGLATDEALYFLTGGNRLTQLTRNVQPLAASNGYTFIPGGLIVQWGLVNGTHAGSFNAGDTGTVTFATANKTFPVACYSVWTSVAYTATPPSTTGNTATVAIDTSTLSGTSFDWYYDQGGATTRYKVFYWIAIGI